MDPPLPLGEPDQGSVDHSPVEAFQAQQRQQRGQLIAVVGGRAEDRAEYAVGWPGTRRRDPDTLGLQLAEAKDLLRAVQETVVDAQVKDTLAAQAACPHCSAPRRHRRLHPVAPRIHPRPDRQGLVRTHPQWVSSRRTMTEVTMSLRAG